MNYLFLNSKAKMAVSDWTKDWSNPHLRVRLWFSIKLSTLYHAPYYNNETFDISITEFEFSHQVLRTCDNDNVLMLTKTLGTLRNSIIIYVSYVTPKQKNMMLKGDGCLRCTFSGKVQQGLLNCMTRQTNCN